MNTLLYNFQIYSTVGLRLSQQMRDRAKSEYRRVPYIRPVPTKWEIWCKICIPSYNQIHVVQILSFKIMIYDMSGLLPYLGARTHYFLEKFLSFLLIFEVFNEPYLLLFPSDLSLILWEQVSYVLICFIIYFVTMLYYWISNHKYWKV